MSSIRIIRLSPGSISIACSLVSSISRHLIVFRYAMISLTSSSVRVGAGMTSSYPSDDLGVWMEN